MSIPSYFFGQVFAAGRHGWQQKPLGTFLLNASQPVCAELCEEITRLAREFFSAPEERQLGISCLVPAENREWVVTFTDLLLPDHHLAGGKMLWWVPGNVRDLPKDRLGPPPAPAPGLTEG